ncbi:sugar 3,4-ketoisomerase [Fusobacterium mortiferum]|jgi:dTDP-4-dehydrorhamnose 3,5-epimerase-like enzyme|uniref:sugar 3,4-ketoisomerase n=1 Tax=Fusobacterium mortiferum TaxID=850 RepID=UPI000E4C6CBC|nr:FdtA/QdtA family cupin domain-containing protein [Fusobacterium mortiferum]RHF69174.1 WxcM-like domain-containing protein [Fusobacterium mortiferum]
MKRYKIINFNEFGDENGKLIAIENSKHIPFDIKRVFYIYGTKNGVVRGQHANRISRFVLICLSGSCEVKIYDKEEKIEENFILDSPKKGLYLDRMIWKDMYNFSKDCVLLVLSDSEYIKDEYIYEKN